MRASPCLATVSTHPVCRRLVHLRTAFVSCCACAHHPTQLPHTLGRPTIAFHWLSALAHLSNPAIPKELSMPISRRGTGPLRPACPSPRALCAEATWSQPRGGLSCQGCRASSGQCTTHQPPLASSWPSKAPRPEAVPSVDPASLPHSQSCPSVSIHHPKGPHFQTHLLLFRCAI